MRLQFEKISLIEVGKQQFPVDKGFIIDTAWENFVSRVIYIIDNHKTKRLYNNNIRNKAIH